MATTNYTSKIKQSTALGVKFVDRSRMGEKQAAICSAIDFAWDNYQAYAWGQDELKPLSEDGSVWWKNSKGLGLTLIDSIDLLWLTGKHKEFSEAREWIEKDLDLEQDTDVNFFETTIRVLGGLLGAYHVSGDVLFRDKAHDLGRRLSGAFDSPSGVPFSDVNLQSGRGFNPRRGQTSLAEAYSVQLEFKYLAHITNDEELEQKVQRSIDALENALRSAGGLSSEGLLPIYLNPTSGRFEGSKTVTLGARGDSYYEYLLKQWLMTSKVEDSFEESYSKSVEGIRKHLVRNAGGSIYVGELLEGQTFSPKMDHLVCFLPGTLALGSASRAGERLGGKPAEQLKLARYLADTCVRGHGLHPLGLAPEIWWFDAKVGPSVKPADTFSLLRPETAESLFYLHRIDGNPKWREAGWRLFQAIEASAKVRGGYASVEDIRVDSVEKIAHRDQMESFFVAETLK